VSSWFRPKRYGYGATPNTWQGWLLTLGFLVLIALVSMAMEPGNIAASGGNWLAALGTAAFALVLFIWIVRKKTEGAWRWRWGSGADRT